VDKVIGHSSETARRFYLLNDREQDARNTLEVASILSPPTATETPTVMPGRLRAILDADRERIPLPIQAAAPIPNTSWKTYNWGSGRPLEENQKRGSWTDEEIERIGVEAKAIRLRFPSN